ncbi:MAG: MBL fold metallo-hydrolase [Verrucomicrobiota bacterium]|nr:MAG: MBL fold metallo-hydrolase [Verrucomicrobiota bacterium]
MRSTTGNFLIDAGLTGRQIVLRLPNFGITIDDIGAVFITHEHADHSQGLRGLHKYGHIRHFANRPTAEAIERKLERAFQWDYFQTGTVLTYGEFEVETFSIPHDAADPVGYIFRSRDGGKSLCWMTDLGYIPQKVREHVAHSDILVLEANYDNGMLENDIKRPFAIKARIRSRFGHLSNESAFDLVARTENPSWQKIFLAHLSRDCNDSRLLTSLFGPAMLQRYNITVIDPEDTSIPVSYCCV